MAKGVLPEGLACMAPCIAPPMPQRGEVFPLVLLDPFVCPVPSFSSHNLCVLHVVA